MKNNCKNNFLRLFIGDSGYACTPFLMTPYINPTSRQQENFNRSHKVTRWIIKRTFGVLKRSFPILHSEIRMCPERVCTIITACYVLHNIAISMKEPEPPEDVGKNLAAGDQDMNTQYSGPENKISVWNYIANSCFN